MKRDKRDRVQIKGYVTIWQGEGKEKKIIVERAENRFVDAGLKGLLSITLSRLLRYLNRHWYLPGSPDGWSMYLGTDTTTSTTHGMTSLQSPIGTAPGTPPNTRSGTDVSNPATGVWRFSLIAVWYAGTVSGTVGELALYMKVPAIIDFGWSITSDYDPPLVMVSRLASADGDFGAFTIDPSKSLTVQWTLEVSFA